MTGERMNLDELANRDDFIGRHIGPRDAEISDMLQTIGVSSLDELMDGVVPKAIRSAELPDIDTPKTEGEALARLRRTADRNRVMKSFIGQGYYGTITPPVILRNVLENPGWYTAYTPYQPEISQGRLEALLNFQQVVIDLTGMDLANASMLDEGTAAAEAMTLARRAGKSKSDVFLVDANAHPQTLAVIETRAEPLGIKIVKAEPHEFAGKDAFGIFVQYPDTFGSVPDLQPVVDAAKEAGQVVTVATDLLALTVMKPPGEFGADIVVGSAQRFGVPMGYGGPHAAFFATRDQFKRSVPGRIVGVSVDRHDRPALRLALQTREQHIRREKATSNICTAQVLLANMAGFYAVWHGPRGLKRIGERVHRLAGIFAAGLERMNVHRVNAQFFDTITIQLGDGAKKVIEAAREAGYNLRDMSAQGRVAVSFDERSTVEDVEVLWGMISGGKLFDFGADTLDEQVGDGFAQKLRRTSGYLSHPVFNSYRSETEMMRYLRRLEQKDIALNRSMIPLGSCTMKLNATSEMIPVTWPEFCDIHPFAPMDQTRGYQQMIDELETMLAKLTGFAAVSLQPNAGSQGEYAGLLTIRAYHQANGQAHRNICLIPSSAHGTNPASAVMAGMKVVVVKCDENGNVDLEDLRARAEDHKDELAALMVTYPSTHGVFEEEIRTICQIVHDAGGQVYLDGANLNAMLGFAQPGEFGADVMHMNLHKTFCIPHGGGGPGVGPIGVAAHLADYLPGHPFTASVGGDYAIGAISAAPWGSAGILPISWVYIVLMGARGLKKATEVAILNANYLAARLKGHFDVLYTGRNGMVAHECILDTRGFKRDPGVSVDDIAKRLMDFGFHAPTMSFPVPDTLMVEPTESESKAELDRFADALIAIRSEIGKIADGTYQPGDNPLHNAPHTLAEVTGDEWAHSYSRSVAAYPLAWLGMDKYFPPVARVDNAAGDRNLVCTCPSPEAYMEAQAAE